MAVKKTLIWALLLLVVFAAVGCKAEDANVTTLKAVLQLVYTAPNEAYAPVFEADTDDEEVNEALAALYGGHIAPDYLQVFFTKVGMVYPLYTAQTGGSVQAGDIQVTNDGEGSYSYTVEVICHNAEGEKQVLQTTGTARFDEGGLLVNLNPHSPKALLEAIGL